MPNPLISKLLKLGSAVAAGIAIACRAATAEGPVDSTNTLVKIEGGQTTLQMPLKDCLSLALSENHRRPASRFAVAMAEAQHRQALAGYWPQINAQAGYERLQQSPDFLFPASSMQIPAGTAVVTVPAGVLGPNPVLLPVSTPAQTMQIPSQDVKLMDPDVVSASLGATWLIYDGGMRKGLSEQSQGLVDMMKQESRRTDLEISDSVTRMYHGAILAGQLYQVGKDTLARMEATLNLTENMYQHGSGKVQKTDWLDNKVMVETLRSIVAQLEKNETMAQSALANTMGMSWNSTVKPVDKEIGYAPFGGGLRELVGEAYVFNPDWKKIEAGIRAAEGAERNAKSGYSPKLALTGELHTRWNNYNAGVATERNLNGWTVGAGMEIPLFSGFLTRNKVAEAKAQISKIKEEQILLKEGIGLQIKNAFLGIGAAEKSHDATLAAMNAATENRDLNTRAYENELVETDKVIRAQLSEALMQAQHYKACYDHVDLICQINLLVGTEVTKRIEGH